MKKRILIIFILFTSLIYSQSFKTKIEKNRFIERKNNKYGVVDSLNNNIIPFKYDFIEFKNNRLIVHDKKLYGLFSLDNKELIPVQYQFLLPRNYNRFILWTENSLFGLSDSNGNIVIPVKYIDISSTENDDFYITKNDKNLHGIYDYNGKNIIAEEYKFYTIDNYKIFATKNNEPQILDIQNLYDVKYLEKDINFIETLRHHSMGESLFQIIIKQNKYGVINSLNELIIPLIYDEIQSSQNWRYFIIKQNNKVGLININGTVVKDVIYDNIELRKEYILLKRKNMKDEIYSYEY
ncbi:WG repeat-containing protein [Flavobacterium sp. ZB4P13]|uniref:WG repeat-containing protein n=1 Tax=Flavobacterium sp. ZB4P13 TaxID=3401728 RepID=UPI003AAB2B81